MNRTKKVVSKIDIEYLKIIRSTINDLHKKFSESYDLNDYVILDVAPEIYEGVKPYFKKALVETIDINPNSGATYISDLAKCENVPSGRFDLIFCTEVLEHTNDPLSCAKSLGRLIKKEGVVVITTPFNFRIHNPLPDNWRFTEHGLRLIFEKAGFSNINISEIPSDRDLMPIQYITTLSRI